MNRKILPGLVGVLLLLVAAGAFYGGMRFQGMRSSGTRVLDVVDFDHGSLPANLWFSVMAAARAPNLPAEC